MKSTFKLLLAISLFLSVSCSGRFSHLEPGQKAIAREVEDRVEELLRVVNYESATNLEGFFSEDNFSWKQQSGVGSADRSEKYDNGEEVAIVLNGLHAERTGVKMKKFCRIYVDMKSDSKAFILARYSGKSNLKDNKVTKYFGHLSANLVKEGDTWKFVYGDNSLIRKSNPD